MQYVIEILRILEREKFYGSLEVKFEAGKVTVLKKAETLKPPADDRRDNRGNFHERAK
jgi:hypothetical protein